MQDEFKKSPTPVTVEAVQEPLPVAALNDAAAGSEPIKSAETLAEERIRTLAKVVCICKGINLGRVLKGMEGCDTVADVNRKVGTGSGGCAGERCGPRIKLLLKKKQATKSGQS